MEKNFWITSVSCRSKSLSEQIYEIIKANKYFRNSILPSIESKIYFLEKISEAIKNNFPIEFISLWGGLKVYGSWKNDQEIELTDYLSIKMLLDLNKAIMQIYPKGIYINIIMEDITTDNIFNVNQERITNYKNNYSSLIKNLQLSNISNLQSESERYLPKTRFQVESEIYNYFEIIHKYYLASANTPDNQKDKLEEYNALKAIGWRSIIPDSNRVHYQNRILKNTNNLTSDNIPLMMSKFYACSLNRYSSKNFFSGKYTEKPLRMSFAPCPPELDPHLAVGRISYRFYGNGTKYNSPPWAAMGLAKYKEGEFSRFLFVPYNIYSQINTNKKLEIIENGTKLSIPMVDTADQDYRLLTKY